MQFCAVAISMQCGHPAVRSVSLWAIGTFSEADNGLYSSLAIIPPQGFGRRICVQVLEHLPGIYRVEGIQRIDLASAVHAIPYRRGHSNSCLHISPGGARYEVAMLHAGVVGFKEFRMNEFNEQIVDSCYLRDEMDYIALGHYHQHYDVAPNAAYSGSTERFSFAESGQAKGFLEVDLASGTRKFMELPARPMIDLGPIDARRLDATSLRAEIESHLDRDLEGKIVRLVVKNLPRMTYEALDFRGLKELAAGAVHFEPRFEIEREKISIQAGAATINSLEHEFVSFLQRYPIEGVDKDSIQAGLEYLKRGLEESD